MKKYFLMIILICISAMTFIYFINVKEEEKISSIIDLQKLTKIAEDGDIEAQIRVLDFYKYKNTLRKPDYIEKKNYWESVLEDKKGTEEWSNALRVVSEEKRKIREKNEKKWARKQVEMQNWFKKYYYMKIKPSLGEAYAKFFDYDEVYSWNKSYIWRYKIIVNIKIASGIKTASAIRELYFPLPDKKLYHTSNLGVSSGEAFAVNLNDKEKMFIILRDPTNQRNRIKSIMQHVFPFVGEVEQQDFTTVLEHYASLSDINNKLPQYLYPTIVHFKDESNPQSIEVVYKQKIGSFKKMQEVEVDNIEAIYGKGVKIDSILIEMTEEIPESKIEDELEFMKNMSEEEITKKLRQTNLPVRFVNGLTYKNFKQTVSYSN
jgi:hypothetical protein